MPADDIDRRMRKHRRRRGDGPLLELLCSDVPWHRAGRHLQDEVLRDFDRVDVGHDAIRQPQRDEGPAAAHDAEGVPRHLRLEPKWLRTWVNTR